MRSRRSTSSLAWALVFFAAISATAAGFPERRVPQREVALPSFVSGKDGLVLAQTIESEFTLAQTRSKSVYGLTPIRLGLWLIAIGIVLRVIAVALRRLVFLLQARASRKSPK